VFIKAVTAEKSKGVSFLRAGGGGYINYSRKKASYHAILHTDYRDPLRPVVDLLEKFIGFVLDCILFWLWSQRRFGEEGI